MRNKGSLIWCICLYISLASFTPLNVLAALIGFNPVYPAFNDGVANRHVRQIGALAKIAAKSLAGGGTKTKGGRAGAAAGADMISYVGKAVTNLAAGGGGSRGGSGATGLDKIKKLTKVAAPLLQLASQLEPNNTLLKTASSLSNGDTEGGTDYMKLADEAAKLASLSGNKKAEQLANQYNNVKKAVGYGQEGSQPSEGEDGGGTQEEEHRQPEGDGEQKQTDQQEDKQEKQEEKARKHGTHYRKKESEQEEQERSHGRRKGRHSSHKHSTRNNHKKYGHRSSRHGYTGPSSKEAQIRKIVQRHAAEMIDSAQKLHTVHHKPTKRKRHSSNGGKSYKSGNKHRRNSHNKVNENGYREKKGNHKHYSPPHRGFSLDDVATNYNVFDN